MTVGAWPQWWLQENMVRVFGPFNLLAEGMVAIRGRLPARSHPQFRLRFGLDQIAA
jgi:hypothetical protein